jgi:hypothetical protein
MLAVALFTASILLFVLIAVLTRALDYIRRHPEVMSEGSAQAYERCQVMLRRVIARSQEIASAISPDALIAWQSPNGRFYTVSGGGVEEQQTNSRVYHLGWSEIGGVGVRMQPGFKLVDADYTGRTTSYSFYLVIVPHSGETMTILIPTHERTDAVEFVAQTLALAGYFKKRVNMFGFNKPPAPARR